MKKIEFKEKTVIEGRKTIVTITAVEEDTLVYEGVAICNEGDVFNAQIGYEIAKSRAYVKARMVEIAANAEIVGGFYAQMNVLQNKIDKLTKYQDSLYMEVENRLKSIEKYEG